MIRIRLASLVAVLFPLIAACGAEPAPAPESVPVREAEGEVLPRELPRVLFVGTSLTEGLGLDRPEVEAWPARIAALADSAGIAVEVVNAGLSGETSAGALRRMEWVLRNPPALLILETGANDGLRGLPPEALEANLDAIFTEIGRLAPGATVVLVGMEAPTNLGAPYAAAFREVYPRTAGRWGAVLLPFEQFLGEVAGSPALNQADGIHPTADGHRRMAEGSWELLEPLLQSAAPPEPPEPREEPNL